MNPGLFLPSLDDERTVVQGHDIDLVELAERSLNRSQLLLAFHRLADDQQMVLGSVTGIAGHQVRPLSHVAHRLGINPRRAAHLRDIAMASLATALAVDPLISHELVAA